MIATAAQEPLLLPPLFTLHRVGRGAFEAACERAASVGAGALVVEERPGVLGLAVVLEPEEPLAAARRAFTVCMAAATDALVAHCPPERVVGIGWPDVIVHDACRIGGGRLAWDAVEETAVPDWLVFGVELIADRDDLAEPGAFPETISLAEEDFGAATDLVESFARNLMLRMDIWGRDGFDAAADGYLTRLIAAEAGAAHAIGPTGDLVVLMSGQVTAHSLAPALSPAAVEARWRDPARGGPRL
jgi:hypothetical protein